MTNLTLATAIGPTLRLTVLVPAYNEAESLPELVAAIGVELAKVVGGTEILIIDDGSSDGTLELLRGIASGNPLVQVISFRRNYGKSAALAVGFAEARGEVIITMDADLQDDPAEIPRLLARLDEGFDVVSGWKQNRQDPFMKTMPSKLFNAVTSSACGLRLHDFNCGLKAWRREAARSLEVYGELHRYLPALSHLQGFKVTELPVRHHARRYGVTKFGSNRFINGFLDLLAVMFLHGGSRSPLHFFGRIGLLFGAVGGIILAYFAVIWVSGQWLRVRPLLLFGVGLVILATQFISLGLLGEMIARGQQQDRTYAIRERIS